VSKTISLIMREYLIRVKTKGFIIGTVLMPVFIVAIMFMPILFSKLSSEEAFKVAIIDLSNQVYSLLIEQNDAEAQGPEAKKAFDLERIPVESVDMDKAKNELNGRIKSGQIDAYVIIPDTVMESNTFELYAKNVSNFAVIAKTERAISDVVIKERLQKSGMDPELVKKLNSRVRARTFKVGDDGEKEERSEVAFLATYFMVFMLYMSLILYGTFVMRGVIEDKNSRVIEVVVSSVKSHQFMAGKIVGIGAAGLTQFLIWVLFAILASTFGLAIVKQLNPSVNELILPSISIWVYAGFIVFFILGYFLYATIYAAVGSMVSTESDAQSMQWPVVMLLIVSFMMVFATIENPDGTLATVISLIPFTAPIIMFFRISMQATTVIQVLLSIVVMIVSIWGLVWLSGRIFRVGILMHGKKPTLPELMKWVRQA